MQVIETPREATIRLDGVSMPGLISGSTHAVKFESDNKDFLKYFPNGNFDTLTLNEKNCSQTQQDIIEVARDLIRRML